MAQKLTREQRDAVRQERGPVAVEDDETGARYYLIDEELHRRAMQALEECDARRAIRAGIEDLEAGRTKPLAEFLSDFETRHGIAGE